MLFTSALFAFLYLPVVFAGFFALGRRSESGAAAWLFLASTVFYGYWMPEFTLLLFSSVGWNFWVGTRISNVLQANIAGGRIIARRWLIAGITVNLLLLAYFKYANFLVDNLNVLFGQRWSFDKVILPIGISFFTFTQIAFLADTFQKGVRDYAFINYGLFVTYFPHLIAGPVLHHAQMMPQFGKSKTYRIDLANVAGGLTIFCIGLFKKIILADGISPYADAVFNAAETGVMPNFTEAWIGALAYTFQLYFDFSGYSDMAIGLSWMFNIRIPFNFNSPYRATNITDFWRRWHMTLSAFLRDYLYIPLGGNRKGSIRRYANLLITMLLGGLWHGANWTFVFWGGLHGFYLIVNHAFDALISMYGSRWMANPLFKFLGWALTFLAVIVAWVFFRATSFSTALRILEAIAMPGLALPLDAIHPLLWNQGLHPQTGLLLCAGLGAVAVLAPNSNHIGEHILILSHKYAFLRSMLIGAALTLGVLLVVINSARDAASAFIYFNF
ncbi:MBOAT family O-acyltransferase [Candidatus Contendibacter odensensis]|uniref:Probable alginate O-acetylase n=1 Tax=Candidatus Contendobacter odensis Run_B_J11 TaxID=1400861 RepID=A0A7U7GE10_9GAMM|nr:MBOAT family protein [Candidatus Contendobacter odensis]CDH46094.1 Membrane bound O-acyl transferase MBOAT family protein [Candidatus Contendobacter odensis Run_B_J11]